MQSNVLHVNQIQSWLYALTPEVLIYDCDINDREVNGDSNGNGALHFADTGCCLWVVCDVDGG